jgi:hypothetical protein
MIPSKIVVALVLDAVSINAAHIRVFDFEYEDEDDDEDDSRLVVLNPKSKTLNPEPLIGDCT